MLQMVPRTDVKHFNVPRGQLRFSEFDLRLTDKLQQLKLSISSLLKALHKHGQISQRLVRERSDLSQRICEDGHWTMLNM